MLNFEKLTFFKNDKKVLPKINSQEFCQLFQLKLIAMKLECFLNLKFLPNFQSQFEHLWVNDSESCELLKALSILL